MVLFNIIVCCLIHISFPIAVIATIITTDNITCFGSDDGTAKVVYSSGTDPNHPRPADSIKWYKLDNGLDFDGINDYVLISDHNQLDLTSNYTIEAWIFPEEFSWLSGIVSKYPLSIHTHRGKAVTE